MGHLQEDQAQTEAASKQKSQPFKSRKLFLKESPHTSCQREYQTKLQSNNLKQKQ